MMVTYCIMDTPQFFYHVYLRIQRAIIFAVVAGTIFSLSALIISVVIYGGTPIRGACIVKGVDILEINDHLHLKIH